MKFKNTKIFKNVDVIDISELVKEISNNDSKMLRKLQREKRVSRCIISQV